MPTSNNKQPSQNFFDRAIEVFSPAWAINRFKARKQLEWARKADTLLNKRKYEGASYGRHTQNWYAPSTSANLEINQALNILRSRSRDLVRNNEHASNIVRVIPNNVVGTGILPNHVKVSGGASIKNIKAAWDDWAGKTVCDFDERLTFYGIQHLVMKAIVESGEALIIRIRSKSNYKIPLRLQVLEGDFIDTTKYSAQQPATDGSYALYGVEFNADGSRKGYWIYDHHPSEWHTTSRFVKAEDVIHLYEIERPGQYRGVPFSKSSMLRINNLGDYEFAEQVRAKVAATFTAFVTGAENGSGDTTDLFSTMEPNTIMRLAPGEEVTFSSPPLTQNYTEFTKRQLQAIAAGNGVTYEAMTNDYSNVNFSSGRMGWIEFSRNVQHWQWNVLIPHLCDRVYQWFVDAAKLAGVIPVTTEMTATWTAPRREMIDPGKETSAKIDAIDGGLKSLSETLREDGYNPDEVFEEIAAEQKKLKELGITLNQKSTSNQNTNAQDNVQQPNSQ